MDVASKITVSFGLREKSSVAPGRDLAWTQYLNLGQKRYLPPPFLMILNMYYPILVDKSQPSQEIARSPSPQLFFVSKSLKIDQKKRREIMLDAPTGRVVTVKGTLESDGECQEKQEKVPLET